MKSQPSNHYRLRTKRGILVCLSSLMISFFPTTPTHSQTANTLNETEKKDGWQLLFNGNNITNWHTYNQSFLVNDWEVKDGAIHLLNRSKPRDGSGDLTTNEDFSDFDLKLEWKIAANGNSGIMFYVQENLGNYRPPFFTGLEMQVLDNNGDKPDAKISTHRAGDLYGLIAGSAETVKPAGQWNQIEICSHNGQLKLWQNGTNVITTTLWDDNWHNLLSTYNATLKQPRPQLGSFKSGKIDLQNAGDEVWFRNIKVKRLSPDATVLNTTVPQPQRSRPPPINSQISQHISTETQNTASAFTVLLRKSVTENSFYGGLTITNLPIDEIKLSNTGSLLFSCNTDKGSTYFLDQTPIAYNGMTIEGKVIYSYTKPDLSREGRYGFVAIFNDNRTAGGKRYGIVINGHILFEEGQIFNNYLIPNLPYNSDHRLRFNEKGEYMVEVMASSTIKKLINAAGELIFHKPISNQEPARLYMLIENTFHDTYNPPSAFCPGNHCEHNSTGLLIYKNGDSYNLFTKENNKLPVSSDAFVMNSEGKIFTGDLQLMDYTDAKPGLITKMDEFKSEHGKYIIDFPCETLIGFKPNSDPDGKPVYSSYTGLQNWHRVAINDNNQVAFFFQYLREGKQITALVKGRPELMRKENEPNACPNQPDRYPEPYDVIIYRDGKEFGQGNIIHAGIVMEVADNVVTKIQSKWGHNGVYESNPDETIYGPNWQIYHSNRENHAGEFKNELYSKPFSNEYTYVLKYYTDQNNPVRTQYAYPLGVEDFNHPWHVYFSEDEYKKHANQVCPCVGNHFVYKAPPSNTVNCYGYVFTRTQQDKNGVIGIHASLVELIFKDNKYCQTKIKYPPSRKPLCSERSCDESSRTSGYMNTSQILSSFDQENSVIKLISDFDDINGAKYGLFMDSKIKSIIIKQAQAIPIMLQLLGDSKAIRNEETKIAYFALFEKFKDYNVLQSVANYIDTLSSKQEIVSQSFYFPFQYAVDVIKQFVTIPSEAFKDRHSIAALARLEYAKRKKS